MPTAAQLARSEALGTIAADAADLQDVVGDVLYDHILGQPLTAFPPETDMVALFKDTFHHSPDFVIHQFTLGLAKGAILIYEQNMVNEPELSARVVEPLLRAHPVSAGGGWADVEAVVAAGGSIDKAKTIGEICKLVLNGCAVLVRAGLDEAMGYNLRKLDKRAIDRPVTEPVIYGPHDGFIEDLGTNLSLVRRRLRNPRLAVEKFVIGKVTATPVYALHLKGVADDHVVAEVRRRLGRIQIDGILDIGYLAEFLKDAPLSPIPQMKRTERPDVVTAGLLEGRIALLADGSPNALVMPISWSHLIKADEDYFVHWAIASTIRMLRLVAFVMATLLPGTFVAITTYHQELIPTPLLLTLAASKENVPLPGLLEVLLMLLLFEIIREAGIRVPRGAGGALTIGGTLVVGDAAVRSGIVSTPITIIAAAVAIGFYIVPNYEFMLLGRMLTVTFLVAGAALGVFGLLFAVLLLAMHLTSLRSFGTPYLAPLAPLRPRQWKDSILIRAPWWALDTRPRSSLVPGAERRQPSGQQPHPPNGSLRG